MDQQVSEDLLEAGRGYEKLFVPALFEVWTRHLIQGAGIETGSQVLDVACGTGILARDALAVVGSDGHVAGADPAPGMLAAAKELQPAIQWLLCPAEELAVEDVAFDCVVSQFGMMFFSDRQQAADEMFRVLKPGGRVAVAVWRSVEHNPAYADIISILEEHVGTHAADALRLPYCLGDARTVETLLQKSGFDDVATQSFTELATFPSSRTMVEAELRGWLPLFDIFLGEDEIAEVLAASDDLLGKYTAPSGEAAFPTSAHVVSARKPAME